ncbi:hypothetical protein ABZ912_44445 [Nonomuraea angiospora]|uniref:hypothetical protein n=1 Tax=Nonomuraea angiospora TaxID=46172 RepID=UPI0033F10131
MNVTADRLHPGPSPHRKVTAPKKTCDEIVRDMAAGAESYLRTWEAATSARP